MVFNSWSYAHPNIFSAFWPTMAIIFRRCGQQCQLFLGAVVHYAEKLIALWATMQKNTSELKLESVPRCCLQSEK
jgi:hypothetical protein